MARFVQQQTTAATDSFGGRGQRSQNRDRQVNLGRWTRGKRSGFQVGLVAVFTRRAGAEIEAAVGRDARAAAAEIVARI